MIKIKDNNIILDGDGYDLMLEATQIILEVILALVENDSLDVENIPEVIDTLTKELYAQTKPLMIKNNKKYN